MLAAQKAWLKKPCIISSVHISAILEIELMGFDYFEPFLFYNFGEHGRWNFHQHLYPAMHCCRSNAAAFVSIGAIGSGGILLSFHGPIIDLLSVKIRLRGLRKLLLQIYYLLTFVNI